MRKLTVVLFAASFVAMTIAPARSALAHGVVGDYAFLEPLTAEDPTPSNEFDIVSPSWQKGSEGNDYGLGFEFEKILWLDDDYMPRFSVGASSGWHHVSPYEGPAHEGMENLEVFAKWAFYYSKKHEFLTSIALTSNLPVGTNSIREQSHTSIGPEFLWEKGFGDLPNRPVLKFLRPIGIQSNIGYLPALGGPASHELFANAVLEYSLPFLSNNVQDIGLKWPLRNIYLFNEFNYDQLIAGPPGATFPSILVTPGIAYVSYYFEIAIGTQLALNNAAKPDHHAAVIGLLDIFYDSMLPKLGNWTINKGLPQ